MIYEILKNWDRYKVGDKIDLYDRSVITKAIELKVISEIKPSKKEDKK